jgi:hypothetical protein
MTLAILVQALENTTLFSLEQHCYEEEAVQILAGLSFITTIKKVERVRCQWCKAESTPLWRKGPYATSSLCNACGVRYLRLQKANPKLLSHAIITLAKK